MLSGQDLLQAVNEKAKYLDAALSQLGKRGRAFADAEMKYRIAKQQAMLTEREKGTPVTILADIVKGKPDIAKLAFDRDVAEVMYKSAMEAINVNKLELNILREHIAREWNRGEGG